MQIEKSPFTDPYNGPGILIYWPLFSTRTLSNKFWIVRTSDHRSQDARNEWFEFIKNEIKPQVKVFFMTAFSINDMEFRRILPFVKIDEFIEKTVKEISQSD